MANPAFLKSGTTFKKGILAILFLGVVLPASAKIVLYGADDAYTLASSPHYLTRLHRGPSSLSAISASTSPQVSRNLLRAHAWSRYDGQNGPVVDDLLVIRPIDASPRQTSLDANMARARAYRSR